MDNNAKLFHASCHVYLGISHTSYRDKGCGNFNFNPKARSNSDFKSRNPKIKDKEEQEHLLISKLRAVVRPLCS